jgi:hypothetical protein
LNEVLKAAQEASADGINWTFSLIHAVIHVGVSKGENAASPEINAQGFYPVCHFDFMLCETCLLGYKRVVIQ